MRNELRPAIVILVALTLVTGLIYPLAMTGVAGVIFPRQAEGSLIRKGDTIIGSALIGQNFAADRYFQGRPSATTAADPADSSKTVAAPYNAASSGGSNLGPSNVALLDRVKEDIAKLKAQNGSVPIPGDLVTTSGSGLDPDISPEAALFQVPRVAKARNQSDAEIRTLVEKAIVHPLGGVLGEPHVNVLALNLALDQSGAH